MRRHEDQARFIEDARRLLAMSPSERKAMVQRAPPGMAMPHRRRVLGGALREAPEGSARRPRRTLVLPEGMPPPGLVPPPSVDHLPPGLAALLEVAARASAPGISRPAKPCRR